MQLQADLPALLEKGVSFRAELLEKVKANASAGKSLGSTLMTQCVVDFGAFDGETENPETDRPSEHDYQVHLLLGILAEASSSDNIPAAAGRIVLDVL